MKWILSKDGKYLYAEHCSSIRADLNGNVYGGGCFGGSKKSKPDVPQAEQVKTGKQLMTEATDWAKQESPLAYGARETGLGRIGELMPEAGFFEQYGPTSLEEAISSQYFKNIMPDIEKTISHQASIRGLEGTVVPMEAIARERGRLGVDIGSYLSNLGQRRGELALQGRQTGVLQQLGLDPYTSYRPYLATDLGQSNLQSQLNIGETQQRYDRQMQEYQAAEQQRAAMIGAIGSTVGGVGGFMVGGPAGASIGAGLGGQASTLFGGQSPTSLGSSMSMAQYLPGKGKFTDPIGGYDVGYGQGYYPGGYAPSGYTQTPPSIGKATPVWGN